LNQGERITDVEILNKEAKFEVQNGQCIRADGGSWTPGTD